MLSLRRTLSGGRFSFYGRLPRADEGNADGSGAAFPRYRFNRYRLLVFGILGALPAGGGNRGEMLLESSGEPVPA